MKKKLLVLLITAAFTLMLNLASAVAIEIPMGDNATLDSPDGFHWGVASVDLSD